MLDAMREAARRVEPLVDRQHLVDRDVADRVRGDPPAGVVRLAAKSLELLAREPQQAFARRMLVVDAQRRRRAAEAAVGEKLDRVDAQHVGDEPLRQRNGRGLAVHFSKRHHVDARRQRAIRIERSIDGDERRRHAAVRRRGDAERQLMAERGGDHPLVVARARRRQHAVDEPHRGLAQQARRLAAVVALDRAARRRLGARADAGARQRRAVDRIDVPARPRQHDRPARRRAIEIAARGRASLPQRRLVVAAPEHPGVLRRAIREPPHVVDERVEARRAAQIEHRRQQMADLPDVRVRIVEAGNQRAAAEVDARRAAVRRAQKIRRLADRRDAAGANRGGRRDRRRRLRQHAAVVEDEIVHGRTLTQARRRA